MDRMEIKDFELSDYWTIISENRSDNLEMVSESGRTSVLIFGGLLIIWSLCLHCVLLGILGRKRQRDEGNSSLRWLLISSSTGQLCIAVIVIPIELVTEYHGWWTLGPVVCKWWRPVNIGLVSLYLWGHFAITVERYIRCVHNSHACLERDSASRIIRGMMILTTWLVAFCCAIIVTIIMRHHDALEDDLCAMSMTVSMAFVLSFVIFFTPVALILTATVALLFVACNARMNSRWSDAMKHIPFPESDPVYDPTDHCIKLPVEYTPERETTLEQNCPSAKLIRLSPDNAAAENISVMITVVANCVAIASWAPFYITNLLVPFCKGQGLCIDPTLWALFLWVGYAGIGISPIIWISEPSVRARAKKMLT